MRRVGKDYLCVQSGRFAKFVERSAHSEAHTLPRKPPGAKGETLTRRRGVARCRLGEGRFAGFPLVHPWASIFASEDVISLVHVRRGRRRWGVGDFRKDVAWEVGMDYL